MYSFLFFKWDEEKKEVIYEKDVIKNKNFICPKDDKYYLSSMLLFFDPTNDDSLILDCYPIISFDIEKDSKFYLLSYQSLIDLNDNTILNQYNKCTIRNLYLIEHLCEVKYIDLLPNYKDVLNKCLSLMPKKEEISSFPSLSNNYLKITEEYFDDALKLDNYSLLFYDNSIIKYDNFENIIKKNTEYRDDFTFKITKKKYTKNYIALYLKNDETFNNISMLFKDLKDIILTRPSNKNERGGRRCLFKSPILHKSILNFIKQEINPTFFVNDLFKLNHYSPNEKFNAHYDTMFIKEGEKFSLYTFLLYFDTEDSELEFENNEKLIIDQNMIVLIPHWIKHSAINKKNKYFLKTEIGINDEKINISKKLNDKFNTACYYLLNSILYPELREKTTNMFNIINSNRFKKENEIMDENENKIFLRKKYMLKEWDRDYKIYFVTDGLYVYFKLKNFNVKMLECVIYIILNDRFNFISCKEMKRKKHVWYDGDSIKNIIYTVETDDIKIINTELIMTESIDTLLITLKESELFDKINMPNYKININFAACQIYLYNCSYNALIENKDSGFESVYNEETKILKCKYNIFNGGLKCDIKLIKYYEDILPF